MRLLAVLAPLACLLAAAAPAQPSGATPRNGLIAFVRAVPTRELPTLFVVAPGRRPRSFGLAAIAPEEPAWSPDGRLLALGAGRGRNEELWLVGADGSGLRRLTRNRVHDVGPAWSPDGGRLVFVRFSGASRSWLATIETDGSHDRRLTYGNLDLQPSWSPDGRWIAFVRIDPRTRTAGIWLVRPDGSGLHRILTRYRGLTDPVWSPDGQRLLLSDGTRLLTARLDGTELRTVVRLTQGAHGQRTEPYPAWSPDGSRIVYDQLRGGTDDRIDLWTVGADGSRPHRLTTSPRHDTNPSWQAVVANP